MHKPADIADLLAGNRASIEPLASSDAEAWVPLVEALLDPPALSPAFAAALWETLPDINEWLTRVDRALAATTAVFTIRSGRKIVFPWLHGSVLAAFPATHEAAIGMRIEDLRLTRRDDGGLADATALYQEIRSHGATSSQLAQVAFLVVNGAFTEHAHETAREYAALALESFEAAGDSSGANLATRSLAAAELYLRHWDKAFELFDKALASRGPLFGGGVTIRSASSDPRDAAIDEIEAISLWVSLDAPEWIRSLGGLAQVFADEPIAATLQARYEERLRHVAQRGESLDDFEVIIRQLRERSFHRSAQTAARIATDANPDDSWILSVYGNISRHLGDHQIARESYLAAAELLEAEESPSAASAWMSAASSAATLGDFDGADAAFARAAELIAGDETRRELDYHIAWSLRQRDPAEARARAYALFRELKNQPRLLAESQVGPTTVDLLLDLLLAERDRDALIVQQALLDAKLALWGESPSVWLERHNLGTVHAQLGNPAAARPLIEAALGPLREAYGDGHPHVEMCQRSLARLDEPDKPG